MSAATLRISTLIATHDRPHFLREALDCLAGQRLPPAEIVVVDDGSGPETRRAVQRWRAQRAPAGLELRYFYQDNSGPAVARNRAIAASRGDYLHFMDDDDLMAPDALQHLAAALAGAGEAAVSMASYTLLHHGEGAAPVSEPPVAPPESTFAERLAAMIAGHWFVPIHGYLFTREAVSRMGPWDPALGSQEDDDYLFRAALEGVRFVPAPAALVHYRQHNGVRRATPGKPGQTVLAGLRQRLQDDLTIRERVFGQLCARRAEERYRAAFQAWQQRLLTRYGPLLPTVEPEAWRVLAWLAGRPGAPWPAVAAGRHGGKALPLQL